MMYPDLYYKISDFKIKEKHGKFYIFDDIRKKYVVLTEEEWVRQNFVKYLILKKGYAEGLIGIEKSTKYNLQKKRMDIVAYNNSAEPILIVECKSFSKPLRKEVLNQVASYNYSLKAPFLSITNGLSKFVLEVNYSKNKIELVDDIPEYKNFDKL